MQKPHCIFVILTNYDETFRNVNVVYNNDHMTNTLGEVLALAGKRQLELLRQKISTCDVLLFLEEEKRI